MVRGLRIAVVVLVTSGVICLASDLPTTPRPTLPDTPRQPAPGAEESAEVLAAQVEVRKAHVRAAEVALRGAKGEREVETATAQLDIRKAELLEAAARLKRVDAKPAGGTIAVFNMAAVMRGYDRARYRVHVLNEKRIGLSSEVNKLKEQYTQLQEEGSKATDATRVEQIVKQLAEITRMAEAKERTVNKALNDEASDIISHCYDEIKAVVDVMAEKKGYQIVFAYPDTVTEDEMKNAYLKELKLKPPAAQPFYVAKHLNLTDDLLKDLNTAYPPLDADGKKVDMSKIPPAMPVTQVQPFVPKRD